MRAALLCNTPVDATDSLMTPAFVYQVHPCFRRFGLGVIAVMAEQSDSRDQCGTSRTPACGQYEAGMRPVSGHAERAGRKWGRGKKEMGPALLPTPLLPSRGHPKMDLATGVSSSARRLPTMSHGARAGIRYFRLLRSDPKIFALRSKVPRPIRHLFDPSNSHAWLAPRNS